jgi:hypothetical protein
MVSTIFMNNSGSGLFTVQDCCSDKEVASEAVVNYRERAAMKSMQQDWIAQRVKIVDEDALCL